MRILVSSHSSEIAGAELCLVELIRALRDGGHSGMVSVPEAGPLEKELAQFHPQFSVQRVPTRRWMGKRFSLIPGVIRLIQALSDVRFHRRLIERHDFDLVVVNTCVIPSPLIAARLSGTRVVTVVRESVKSNPTLRSVVPRAVICSAISILSDLVIVNSEYIAEQFGRPSELIYPSLSSRFVDVDSGRGVSNRSRFVEGPFRIVMLGTLSSEKGQIDLVMAASILKELGLAFEVGVYGYGDDRAIEHLKMEIDVRGLTDHVRYYGHVQDSKSVLVGADVSVVCSKNEAFGKVTVESIACETPVVGYGCGGTAEIIRQGGGVLVPPDHRELARALMELAVSPDTGAGLSRACRANSIVRQCTESATKTVSRLESVLVGPKPTEQFDTKSDIWVGDDVE